MLTVGSLFAGIGGFDLGFERAGMRTLWQVEQSEFCRRVLERHFPDAQRFEDVRDVGAAELAPVDIICGGFPCQDLSYAGKGAGIDGARSGLWSEYARIVRELRPRYVVVENVSALLARGLGRVLGDLAEIGYDAEWDCIPASAVGAPHRRDRIWLVAYANRDEHEGRTPANGWQAAAELPADPDRGRLEVGPKLNGEPDEGTANGRSRGRHADGLRYEVADATVTRLEGSGLRGRSSDSGEELADADCSTGGAARGSGEAVSRPEAVERLGRCGGGEGSPWAVEPDVGRVAHGVPSRVDRLAALGNALVPQIAEWIGRRIIEAEGGIAA